MQCFEATNPQAVNSSINTYLYSNTNDQNAEPHPKIRQLVEAGGDAGVDTNGLPKSSGHQVSAPIGGNAAARLGRRLELAGDGMGRLAGTSFEGDQGLRCTKVYDVLHHVNGGGGVVGWFSHLCTAVVKESSVVQVQWKSVRRGFRTHVQHTFHTIRTASTRRRPKLYLGN